MKKIKHDVEFELYHYHESLCSQMVRLALEEKQIEWKSHPIILNELVPQGDNLTPEYLAINPKGLVPTLVHSGTPVYDSWVIVDYLDKTKPQNGTSLTPQDTDKQSQMRAFITQASLDESVSLGASLGTAIPVLTVPVLRHCIKQQSVLSIWWKYRKHPLADRRWGIRIARLMPLPKSLSEKSVKIIGEALKDIEKLLGHGEDYLLGDYSQADILMTAHFHRLEDVALGDLLVDDKLPNIAAYWQRLQSRPSYKKAVTDWHDPIWRQALEDVFKGQPSPELEKIRNIAFG